MTVGPIIIPADVEQLVIDALDADFATTYADHENGIPPAGTKTPNPRPTWFVRVMRSGGPRETLISENAWVILEAWAGTEQDAIDLLNRARAVLAAQDGPLFGYGESGGPTNLPDPRTDQIRYTALVTVRARGASA